MGKSETESAIATIDQWIREGRGGEARGKIVALICTELDREHLGKVAALARRVNLPELGVKLLAPLVRPSNKQPATATPAEKAEYGACLSKIGATDEALDLFSQLDPHTTPEVALYQCFARFSKWDYEGSISGLRTYVANQTLSEYQRLVGRVNLCAALVFTRRHEEADDELRSLYGECQKKQLHLLGGNALELLAQNAISQKRWVEATLHLEASHNRLSSSGSREEFYVRKWRAFLNVFQQGFTVDTAKMLELIRQEALSMQSWETLRECDRVLAQSAPTAALRYAHLAHLYFGTPFPAYRQMLSSHFNLNELQKHYSWRLGASGEAAVSITLNRLTESLLEHNKALGKVPARLLVTLSSDFYRPQRLATLHAKAWRGEYYNPTSTPLKVHQALFRLRSWFQRKRLPLRITENDGAYSLTSSAPFLIHLIEDPKSGRVVKGMLKKLWKRWPQESFTLTDAHRLTKIPRRTLQRLLTQEVQSGLLLREGMGPATRYRFNSHNSLTIAA